MFRTADETLRDMELKEIELHDRRLEELRDIYDFVLLPRLEEAEDRLREETLFRRGLRI